MEAQDNQTLKNMFVSVLRKMISNMDIKQTQQISNDFCYQVYERRNEQTLDEFLIQYFQSLASLSKLDEKTQMKAQTLISKIRNIEVLISQSLRLMIMKQNENQNDIKQMIYKIIQGVQSYGRESIFNMLVKSLKIFITEKKHPLLIKQFNRLTYITSNQQQYTKQVLQIIKQNAKSLQIQLKNKQKRDKLQNFLKQKYQAHKQIHDALQIHTINNETKQQLLVLIYGKDYGLQTKINFIERVIKLIRGLKQYQQMIQQSQQEQYKTMFRQMAQLIYQNRQNKLNYLTSLFEQYAIDTESINLAAFAQEIFISNPYRQQQKQYNLQNNKISQTRSSHKYQNNSQISQKNKSIHSNKFQTKSLTNNNKNIKTSHIQSQNIHNFNQNQYSVFLTPQGTPQGPQKNQKSFNQPNNLFNRSSNQSKSSQSVNKNKNFKPTVYINLQQEDIFPTPSEKKHQQPKVKKEQSQNITFKRPAQMPTNILQQQINQKNKKQTDTIKKDLEQLKIQTNQVQCIETLLKQLQISCLQNKINPIKRICQKLNILLANIRDYQEQINEIKNEKDEDKRLKLCQLLSKKVIHLNFKQIVNQKNYINSIKQKHPQMGILLLGNDGVGKSTIQRGLAGPKNKNKLNKILKVQTQNKQSVYIIDTTGLQTNRIPQNDLINSYRTTHFLSKMKKIRILIVISQCMMIDKQWSKKIKQLLKTLSNYLTDIQDIRTSISLVLTKNLTSNLLNKKLKQFRQQYEDQNKNKKLTQEESDILSLMINITNQKNQRLFQINDPNTYDFSKMLNSLITMKTKTKQSPQKCITLTLYEQTIKSIKKSFDYLKTMVIIQIEKDNPKLINFYFNKLIVLQNVTNFIQTQQIRKKISKQLNKKIKDLVYEIQQYLDDKEQDIKQIKREFEFITDSSLKEVYDTIYGGNNNNQKSPLQILDGLIRKITKQTKDIFINPVQIKSQKRKKGIALLDLLQILEPKLNQQTCKKVQKQNKQIDNKLRNILRNYKFDLNQFKQITKQYFNKFMVDKLVTTSMIQEKFGLIIKQYLNNFYTNQFTELKNVLKKGKKSKFIQKQIQALKYYSLKIKALRQLPCLRQIISKQQRQSIKLRQEFLIQIQKQVINMITHEFKQQYWQLQQYNRRIIIQYLLLQNSQHDISQYNNQQVKTITLSVKKLQEKIRYFVYKTYQTINKNMVQIHTQQSIHTTLQYIIFLQIFLTQRKQVLLKKVSHHNQYSASQIQMQYSSQTGLIKKIDKIMVQLETQVNKCTTQIENKTKKYIETFIFTNLDKIDVNPVNPVLIIYLLITKNFNMLKTKHLQQIIKLQKSVIIALSQPICLLNNLYFNQYEQDFVKLYETFKYIKLLKDRLNQFSDSRGFGFVDIVQENKQDIKQVYNRALTKMKQENDKLNWLSTIGDMMNKSQFKIDSSGYYKKRQQLKLYILKQFYLNRINQFNQFIPSPQIKIQQGNEKHAKNHINESTRVKNNNNMNSYNNRNNVNNSIKGNIHYDNNILQKRILQRLKRIGKQHYCQFLSSQIDNTKILIYNEYIFLYGLINSLKQCNENCFKPIRQQIEKNRDLQYFASLNNKIKTKFDSKLKSQQSQIDYILNLYNKIDQYTHFTQLNSLLYSTSSIHNTVKLAKIQSKLNHICNSFNKLTKQFQCHLQSSNINPPQMMIDQSQQFAMIDRQLVNKVSSIIQIHQFNKLCEQHKKEKYMIKVQKLQRLIFDNIYISYLITIRDFKDKSFGSQSIISRQRPLFFECEVKLLQHKNQLLMIRYKKFLQTKNIKDSLRNSYSRQLTKIKKQNQNNQSKYSQNQIKIDQQFIQYYKKVDDRKKSEFLSNIKIQQSNWIDSIKTKSQTNYDEAKKQFQQKQNKIKQYPLSIRNILSDPYKSLKQFLTTKMNQQISNINSCKQSNQLFTLLNCLTSAIVSNNSACIKISQQKLITQFDSKNPQLITQQNIDSMIQQIQKRITVLSSVQWLSLQQQKNCQLKKIKALYIANLKQQILSLISNYVNEKYQSFKEIIKDKHKLFKIYSFSNQQNSTMKTIKNYLLFITEIIKFIKLDPDNFSIQNKLIKQQMKKMKEIIEFMKEIQSQMQKYNTPSKENLRKQFLQAVIIKEFLKQFLGKNASISPLLDQYSIQLQQLKQKINRIQQIVLESSLKQFLRQTKHNNSKRVSQYKKINFSHRILFEISSFFNDSSQTPDINIKTQKQNKNKQEFQQLQLQALNQINSIFISNNKQCVPFMVQQIYDLVNVIEASRQKSSLFPRQVKIQNVIDKLKESMDKNCRNIKQFKSSQNRDKYIKLCSRYQQAKKNRNQKLNSLKNVLLDKQTKNLQIQKNDYHRKLESIPKEKSDIEKQTEKNNLKRVYQMNTHHIKNDFIAQFKKQQSKIQKQCAEQLKLSKQSISDFLYHNLANYLIIDSRARSNFNCQEYIKNYPQKLDYLLKQAIQNTTNIVEQLYHILDEESRFGAKLCNQLSVFKKINCLKFNDLTKNQNFNTLLAKIPNNEINKEQKQNLIKLNYRFEEQQNKCLNAILKSKDREQTKKKIIEESIKYGTKLHSFYIGKKPEKNQDQRILLLVHISVLYTIIKTSKQQKDTQSSFVYKIHPGQILSLFLLLGFNKKDLSPAIQRTMIQISTGEGKSIILGILSAYLGLVGFKVYEACYSDYLSQRDKNEFNDLFQQLNLKQKIQYAIFPKICQLILAENTNPQSRFNNKVENILFKPQWWNKIKSIWQNILPNKRKTQQSILLIDEADVFLDPKYLGQTYRPSISVRKSEIEHFFNQVWSLRDQKVLHPNNVYQLQSYKSLCKSLNEPILVQILSNQVHAMIRALKTYKDEKYKIDSTGQILYLEMDGLTCHKHNGWKTIWCYYKQWKRPQASKYTSNAFKNILSLNLIAASFSYAKLPEYFSSILGVTGTLASISPQKKKILKDVFHVSNQYVLPTIFPSGKKQLKFTKCNTKFVFQKIVSDMKQKLSQNLPVLIFFQSKCQLQDFFNSSQFKDYKLNPNVTAVTYQQEQSKRDSRLENSTQQGRITLLTDNFSRGTDFPVNISYKQRESYPGLHVISSYLPKQFSDYIQLIGRTGRLGTNGSVSIFIPSEQENLVNLALKGIQMDRIEVEELIKKNELQIEQKSTIMLNIQKANKEHKQTFDIYESKNPTKQIILTYMKTINHQQLIAKTASRTIIGLDATISMSSAFHIVKSVIKQSIPCLYQILNKANVSAQFQFQIVIYRNYSSGHAKILQHSNFQINPQVLVNFISQVNTSGGDGNEAVQVLLQYVNSLSDINQCFIITDALPNSINQTQNKRKKSPITESQWTTHGFPPTNMEKQLQIVKYKKIKLHPLYISKNIPANREKLSKYYNKISEETGGMCQQFVINDGKQNDSFKDFVSKRILASLQQYIGRDVVNLLLRNYDERPRYT